MNTPNLHAILCLALGLVGAVAAQEVAFFRGDLSEPSGGARTNPCVEDVIQAVNTLRDRGETLGFNLGADYPPVRGAGTQSHWQGVQRLPGMGREHPFLVVSSSHRDVTITVDGRKITTSLPAHFAVVEMASRRDDGRRLRSNRLQQGQLTRNVPPPPQDRIVHAQPITPDFDHPGGIQVIGQYLLVGADGNIDHDRNVALFTLWDLSNPTAPREVWQPKWELPVRNANSVGITRLEGGGYLFVRALKDAKDLEFYLLQDDLEVSPATYLQGPPWDRWNYTELQSELVNEDGSLDRSWGDLGSILGEAGYQNINVVTECGTGQLYLIASHGRKPSGFGGQDVVDAFRLEVPTERPDPNRAGEGVVITKVATRRVFPEQNAGARQGDLQAAAGVYVSPDHKLYFYATEHGVTSEGFVRMIEFAPRAAVSRSELIDDAWVELYEHNGLKGRSIMLDYRDRALRDYDDFSNVEEFNDRASSVLFLIPSGYRLRLFMERARDGAFLDLVGNGQVQRIDNFSQFVLSDGLSANDRVSSAEWIDDGIVTSLTTAEFPTFFELQQNYPNPFNPETAIRYRLDRNAWVHLGIYDIRGQLIKTLAEGWQTSGVYSVVWNGRDELGREVASGTYLSRLEVEGMVQVKRLVLLR